MEFRVKSRNSHKPLFKWSHEIKHLQRTKLTFLDGVQRQAEGRAARAALTHRRVGRQQVSCLSETRSRTSEAPVQAAQAMRRKPAFRPKVASDSRKEVVMNPKQAAPAELNLLISVVQKPEFRAGASSPKKCGRGWETAAANEWGWGRQGGALNPGDGKGCAVSLLALASCSHVGRHDQCGLSLQFFKKRQKIGFLCKSPQLISVLTTHLKHPSDQTNTGF